MTKLQHNHNLSDLHKQQLTQFFKALFGELNPNYIEQRGIITGKGAYKKAAYCWRSVEALIEKYNELREQYRRRRVNWYFTVLPVNSDARKRVKGSGGAKGGLKEHIQPGRAIFADIDDKDTGSHEASRAAWEALNPRPSAVVDSGRGFHIYYFLKEAADPGVIEGMNKKLLKMCQGDPAAWNRNRLLRMPLSWHVKGDDMPVRFVHVEGSYTMEALQELLGAPEPVLELVQIPITPPKEAGASINELMASSQKLSDLYYGTGKTGGNTSRSGYDWAFCMEALYLGAHEYDVAAALSERMAATGRSPNGRYVEMTVGKALAKHRQRALSRAPRSTPMVRVASSPPSSSTGAVVAAVAPAIDEPLLTRYPDDYANKALRGRPHKSLTNCVAILRWYQSKSSPSIRYNDFDYREEYNGERMADHYLTGLRLKMAQEFGVEFAADMAKESFQMVARDDSYHPVQERLMAIHKRALNAEIDNIGINQWDQGWLERYCGIDLEWGQLDDIEDEIKRDEKSVELFHKRELIREIGLRWLLSCIARIFQPGCKVDTCLILCGGQGAGKGEFFKIMSLERDMWHSDNPLDVRGGRDTYTKMRGKWIWEFAELASLKHKEANAVKQFITAQSYEYRPAFGKYDISQKAGTVFVGTSNEREILRDPTGSRRFWPVSVGVIDEDGLKADVEAIWAQAMDIYLNAVEAGEANRYLWSLPRDMWALLEDNNESYQSSDAWHDVIADWAVLPSTLLHAHRACDILHQQLGIEPANANKAQTMRLAGILSGLNFKKVKRTIGGRRVWAWEAPKT